MQREAKWDSNRLLFRSIVEASGLMGWVCEDDGYCIYLSPAWHDFTATDDGEGINWVNSIHPEDRVRARQVFFTANDTHSPYLVNYRLLRADGTYHLASAHGVPHVDEDGNYNGLLGLTILPQPSSGNGATTGRERLLSPREREVFELFAKGYTIETAAVQLGISAQTVKAHANNASVKLRAVNRTHAVVRAITLNEIEPIAD
jgi:PAS domain S-box-containing protein